MKRVNFRLFASAIALVASSCVKDVVVDSNFHGTSSEKICFGAELRDSGAETRSGVETNRLGNHILKSDDMEFPVGVYQQNGINTGADAETRGEVFTNAGGISDFTVWAKQKENANATAIGFFNNVVFEKNTADNIFYSTGEEYFWPGGGELTFIATTNTPESGFTPNYSSTDALESFSYTVPDDPTQQNDIVLAKSVNDGATNQSVPLTFNHIMTAVNVKIGQVVEGEILSVTFRNVYNKGNYLVDQGVWVVDKTSTTDYSVKMENNKFESNGNNSGDLVNANNAVFMFIPQNPGDNARMDIVFKDSEGNTHNLSGSIADDNWEICKTTNYMLSIDQSFTLTIEPVGKKLDAHYVIGQFTVTTKDVPNWVVSVSAGDDADVTILPEDEVNAIAKQGFWTDYEVDAKGNIISTEDPKYKREKGKSARGISYWEGSGDKTDMLFYIFVPENIKASDREITVTLESKNNKEHITKKVLLQKSPNWTTEGFGWEVVDDDEQGKYGFKWDRQVAYVFGFSYSSVFGQGDFGTNYSGTDVTSFLNNIINPYNGNKNITSLGVSDTNWISIVEFKLKSYRLIVELYAAMRQYIWLDYSKLNNITGASSQSDGLANTKYLCSLGGSAASFALELAIQSTTKLKGDNIGSPALDKVVSGDRYNNNTNTGGQDVPAETGVANDLSGILTYIQKKNRYYLQTTSTDAALTHHAYFDQANDLKWYLPACGQFEYFTPDPNIPGDNKANYWSSTAADGAEYSYRGNGAQERRSTELRVIAVRRDENGYGNATATVDNTTMQGGDNGEAQWVE